MSRAGSKLPPGSLEHADGRPGACAAARRALGRTLRALSLARAVLPVGPPGRATASTGSAPASHRPGIHPISGAVHLGGAQRGRGARVVRSDGGPELAPRAGSRVDWEGDLEGVLRSSSALESPGSRLRTEVHRTPPRSPSLSPLRTSSLTRYRRGWYLTPPAGNASAVSLHVLGGTGRAWLSMGADKSLI